MLSQRIFQAASGLGMCLVLFGGALAQEGKPPGRVEPPQPQVKVYRWLMPTRRLW